MQEKYEKAIELYEQSLRCNPNNILVLHNTAVSYKYMNNNEKAIEFYLKVLAIEPTFFRSLRNLAEIYIEIQHVDLAKPLIQKALEIQANSVEIKELAQKVQM